MKYLNFFKISLIALFTFSMAVLALPEFTVEIAGREFTYPSVGFSRIGIGKDFPSFQGGRDVFPTVSYKFLVDFQNAELTVEDKKDQFMSIVKRIQNRAEFASFYDINIEGRISGDNYYIVIDIPSHYGNTRRYADFLTTKGEIIFSSLQFDGEGNIQEKALDFDEGDIISVKARNSFEFGQQVTDRQTGALITQTQNQPGDIIELDFREEKTVDLNQISNFVGYVTQVTSGTPYLTNMSVDDRITFELIYDDLEGSRLFGLPITANTSREVDDSIQITRAIFQETEPMRQVLNFESETSVAPSYNPEGGSFIAGMFITAFTFLSIYLFTQFGKKKASAIIILSSIQILTAVNILKLVQVPISSGLIIGSIVALIISVVSYVILVRTEIDHNSKNIVTISYTILGLAAVVILRLNTNIGLLTDVLLVILCFALSAAFITFFFTNSIFRTLKLLN